MFFWFLILILKLISIKVSSGEIYLAKVSHIKQVEGVKQVTLLHGKHRVAWRQKCADVLQAQELQSWGLKKIKYWKSELKQYTSNIFCLRLGQTGVSHFQITGKVVCNKAGFFFICTPLICVVFHVRSKCCTQCCDCSNCLGCDVASVQLNKPPPRWTAVARADYSACLIRDYAPLTQLV